MFMGIGSSADLTGSRQVSILQADTTQLQQQQPLQQQYNCSIYGSP
jgi:hypothetical protein